MVVSAYMGGGSENQVSFFLGDSYMLGYCFGVCVAPPSF